MIKRIEYGVLEVETEKVVLMGDEDDREDAFAAAKDWARNLGRQYIVVERTVEISDWKPTNTGVVGPFTQGESNDVKGLGPGVANGG